MSEKAVSCTTGTPGWKLFNGEIPEPVASLATRDWMNLAKQPGFQQRASMVVDLVRLCAVIGGHTTVTELGCGDGSLLQKIERIDLACWGYEIGDADIAYARTTLQLDVKKADIVAGRDVNGERLAYGEIVVISEVLEHLADPVELLRKLPNRLVIASSPSRETGEWHNPIHAWAWDENDYRRLFELAGYTVLYQAECEAGLNSFNGVVNEQCFQAVVAVKLSYAS